MERQPQLAGEQVSEIDEILLPERPIEPELARDLLLLLRVQRLAEIGGERVAGHEAEHEEEDGHDDPQHEDAVNQSPPGKAHVVRSAAVMLADFVFRSDRIAPSCAGLSRASTSSF